MTSDRLVVTGIHLPYIPNAPSIGDRPPLALGMVMAHARGVLGHDGAFDLEPRFATSVADVERITKQPGRHVLLYSDYVWNYDDNMALSQHIKSLRPDVINVHGGANAPSYPEACERFLREHADVDYVVKGEGESAIVDLLRSLAAGEAPASAIPSVSMIVDGRFVQSAVRERTRQPDEFPSPYLSGLFDGLTPERWASATIESNRGCPYGCTFCDWGAATLQKIRTFSLERVRAEVTWLAERRVPAVFLADANFGILPRDVDVARAIVDVKKTYDYPKRLTTCYAKNTHRHLVEIIELFIEAGLISNGIVAIQTRDARTLDIVRRTNIKTDEYDKLRAEFQQRGLPLAIQLMIGLPGATVAVTEADLAYYFDTPVQVEIYRTVLLPNSPMADPAYQAKHAIVHREDGLVTSTATMSEQDFETATLIGRAFNGAQHFGLLRYLLVFLRWEYRLEPTAVLHALADDEAIVRARFPLLHEILEPDGYVYDLSASHARLLERGRTTNCWPELHAQFSTWAGERFGVGRGTAWQAVCDAQAAVMPVEQRTYPFTIELAHDVARWYADGRSATERCPLATYPPGRLVVEDPLQFSTHPYVLRRPTRNQWELASALARARAGELGGPKRNPSLRFVHAEVGLPWALINADG